MTALDYDDISAGSLVGVPHVGQGHLTLDTRDEMLWHHYAKQQQQQQQHQQHQHQHQQQQQHHHHPHLQQQPPQHYYNDGVGTWLLRGGGGGGGVGGGGFNATPTSVAAQIGRLSPSAENLPSTLQQHQLALQQQQQQQQQQQGMDATSFGVAPKFHQSDPELLYGNEAPLLLQDCNADSMVSRRYCRFLSDTIDAHNVTRSERATHYLR